MDIERFTAPPARQHACYQLRRSTVRRQPCLA